MIAATRGGAPPSRSLRPRSGASPSPPPGRTVRDPGASGASYPSDSSTPGPRGRRPPTPASARGAASSELLQLRRDAVLDPVGIPPFLRIDLHRLQDHRVMQVVAAGEAAGAAVAEGLAALHRVADLDREAAQMAVQGQQAVAVVDDDGVAVDAEEVGHHDDPVV